MDFDFSFFESHYPIYAKEKKIDVKNGRKEVTDLISRNIAAGHEKDYDDWLQRFMTLERQLRGYPETTIIAPGGNTSSVRYVINRLYGKIQK